jgi:hypothetical protein
VLVTASIAGDFGAAVGVLAGMIAVTGFLLMQVPRLAAGRRRFD